MSFNEKFLNLGSELPPIPQVPANLNFLLWRQSGSLLFLAGHGPTWGADVRYTGKIDNNNIEYGYSAARLTTLNLLQTTQQALSTLDRVVKILDVTVLVNSTDGFTKQPLVANGCSDCLVEIFNDAGKHSRAAIGVAELPLNFSIEIKMILEFKL